MSVGHAASAQYCAAAHCLSPPDSRGMVQADLGILDDWVANHRRRPPSAFGTTRPRWPLASRSAYWGRAAFLWCPAGAGHARARNRSRLRMRRRRLSDELSSLFPVARRHLCGLAKEV
jgi:hypothetical protein